MSKNLRYASIAALVFLIGVPIVYYLLMPEPQFAVAVMLVIAVVGFFTVIFVMIIGAVEDHYPSAAQDSSAVSAWSERLAARQAKLEEEAEKIVEGDDET